MWREETPAKRLLFTSLSDICGGRSLRNIQNRCGPNTELWGAPDITSPLDEESLFRKTYCVLFVKYEGRKGSDEESLR